MKLQSTNPKLATESMLSNEAKMKVNPELDEVHHNKPKYKIADLLAQSDSDACPPSVIVEWENTPDLGLEIIY